MGCGDSRNLKKDVMTDTYENKKGATVPSLSKKNNFEFWYQVFDFLELQELLYIAVVCKTWHSQSGVDVILQKFAKGRRISPFVQALPDTSLGDSP
jgi:hypothetical protein